jgi:hypothetical protein
VVLAFLIAAGIWVLAWVVLIVLGLVKILFPIPDEDCGKERNIPGEGPAG